MKIITVIGARPQIIKASALSRAVKNKYSDSIHEIIVHTGQHYDGKMSDIFFSQLQIPQPDYNLHIGSASHGKQTAGMIEGLEEIFIKEQPDAILIYGDTNSTLAGAVAAAKLLIPIVHVEAGLRSFDKTMPEEVNRILADNVSTLLFTPTQTGYDNLLKEGFNSSLSTRPTLNSPNIYLCGDVMYDNTLYFKNIAISNKDFANSFGSNFILCTIHRNTNTDNKERLSAIFTALNEISKTEKIILPLHPRTRKMIPAMLNESLRKTVFENPNINVIDPVGFLEMTYLENYSKMIITDSGGVQKEAYFLKKPCVILRPHTEWTEIVNMKAAAIADANTRNIISATEDFLKKIPDNNSLQFPEIFGNGKTAEFICRTMLSTLA